MHRPRYLLVGFLLAAAGCSDDTGGRLGVSGTVTLRGQPLDQGTIQFLPLDGQDSTSGAAIANGRYDVPRDRGLQPGRYRVVISSGEPGTTAEDEAPGQSLRPAAKERVPPAYSTDSQQVVEVKARGANEFKFDIP